MKTGNPLRLMILGLAMASASAAQSTYGAIVGRVTDPSGGVVAGATVSAANRETGLKIVATTNDSGLYTLSPLRDGAYTVRVEAPGFKSHATSDFVLLSRATRRLDAVMELGETTTSIDVAATAGLLETESARVADIKSIDTLNALPITSRSLRNFLVLTPNVVQSAVGARVRIGGGLYTQNEFTIDGVSINNGFNGNPVPTLISYIDSFQELRVDSSSNPAEFGAMGQVTVISKSGSNQLHGAAFDYYSTPVFRARNPFAAERGAGIVHEPGFSIGGPVILPRIYNGRNRTFFFTSFEGSRGSQTGRLLNAGVPLGSWRAGDFSGSTIRDPSAGNQPFAGGRIPSSRINAVSQRIQERFYPLPNYGDTTQFAVGNFRQVSSIGFDGDSYVTARLDQQVGSRHQVFARGTYRRAFNDTAYNGALPTMGTLWTRQDSRNLSASYTWTISSNLLHEVRGGMAYTNAPRTPSINGQQIVREMGMTGLAPNIPEEYTGLFRLAFSNLALTAIQGAEAYRKPGFLQQTSNIQDMVRWYRGRHSARFGVNITTANTRDQMQSSALFGIASFSNRFTGHTYADFLLGIPTSVQRAFPVLETDQRRWATDFFFQDDVKLTPSLTLNFGLRYEIHPPWTAPNGRQSTFDLQSGKIVVPDGSLSQVSPLFPRGYVNVVEAGSLGLPDALIRTDRNNFAPRFGFAWRPWGAHTVIRGGFGMFYDLVNRVPETSVPFQINEPAYTNPAINPVVILPRIFPDSSAGVTSSTLPAAVRADLRIPMAFQYNFTVEHQRWSTAFRATYQATGTRQTEWIYDANQPAADTRLYVDKPRRFPLYPSVSYASNGASNQYHGLTLEAERRMARGLQWQASWTWSRDIGDVERGGAPENAFDLARERGPVSDMPQHRFVANLTYDLPFGKGRKYGGSVHRGAQAIAGGWTASLTYMASTGAYLTPTWTGRDTTGTRYTDSRTAPQITLRPDVLRDPRLSGSERTLQRWFDPTAFTAPAAGQFGTSGTGLVMGPGFSVMNAGAYKEFPIRERVRLRAELTASNALNHPNYRDPSLNISAQAGVINGIRGAARLDLAFQRNLRAGIRLDW